jgi:hypothetical protein
MSLSINTLAVTNQATKTESLSASEEQTFINANYTKYTINLNNNVNRVMLDSPENERQANYNQAVAFVNSLDLTRYPEIKDENLKYLESLYNNGATIISYSVLVPLSDDLYTYGTYNGRAYYKYSGQLHNSIW